MTSGFYSLFFSDSLFPNYIEFFFFFFLCLHLATCNIFYLFFILTPELSFLFFYFLQFQPASLLYTICPIRQFSNWLVRLTFGSFKNEELNRKNLFCISCILVSVSWLLNYLFFSFISHDSKHRLYYILYTIYSILFY